LLLESKPDSSLGYVRKISTLFRRQPISIVFLFYFHVFPCISIVFPLYFYRISIVFQSYFYPTSCFNYRSQAKSPICPFRFAGFFALLRIIPNSVRENKKQDYSLSLDCESILSIASIPRNTSGPP
jgi:hypothetical protein